MPGPSPLTDLIDLYTALRADQAVDLAQRRQRDRKLGTALQQYRAAPARQLRGWLARVHLPAWRRDGHAAVQLFHAIGLALAVLGLVAGWGVAQAALYYTGDAPINIVNVLVVLILPQLVLLAFWCVTALPGRLPLLGRLQALLRVLNPGRLARLAVARFPSAAEQRLAVVWDPENAIALAPAARWLFSLWSQLFALAFNAGALLAILYLVAFSDLAFGWSTTLALESSTFLRVVSGLAWPWQALVPEALPSAALVEASRYFRLEAGVPGGAAAARQAALLGAWWPFLVAALVCYGLLPRLLTLLLSWQRFNHHLRRALVCLPGAPELLARMNSPLVNTAALEPERAPEFAGDTDTPREVAQGARLRCPLVAWSGSVPDPDALQRRLPDSGIEPLELLHAGGAQSTAQDRATVAALCRERAQGVAIVVKAWEPPLLEFVDFVQQVRSRCRHGQPIVVLLWGGAAPVSTVDAEVWRLTLRQLADPDLHIEALA